MRSNSELKAAAREKLKGQYGNCIIVLLIAGVINQVSMGVGALWTQYGLCRFYLNLVRGEEAKINDLFDGFKGNLARVPLTTLLMGVFIVLWAMLLYIPGIIKSFSYSQTMFLLCDNSELEMTNAITASREMMNGHKMEMFLLGLSFIGWILLICVTFGIAAFYVVPYMSATFAEYYEDLKDEVA